VCCAAAVANLRIYEEEKIFENVEKQGRYLSSRLEALEEKIRCVGDVRYKGYSAFWNYVKDKVTREPLAPLQRNQPGDGEAARAL